MKAELVENSLQLNLKQCDVVEWTRKIELLKNTNVCHWDQADSNAAISVKTSGSHHSNPLTTNLWLKKHSPASEEELKVVIAGYMLLCVNCNLQSMVKFIVSAINIKHTFPFLTIKTELN